MNLRTGLFKRVALCVCVLSAISAPGALARGARTKVSVELAEQYRKTSLVNLRAAPKSYVDSRVSFLAYFRGRGALYRPFYTRYTQDMFANIHVWEEGAHLWDKKERGNIYPLLYINRSRRRLTTLIEDLGKFETIRIYGHVTSAHNGMPWVEVRDIVQLPSARNYSTKALKHIEIGVRSANIGEYDLAARSFKRALQERMPPAAVSAVNRMLGVALFELGSYEEAQSALEIAVFGAKGIPSNENDAELRLVLGQSMLLLAIRDRAGQKQLRQALEHLKAAVDLEPGSVAALAAKGLCHGYLHEWKQAYSDLQDALKLDEANDRAMRNLAVVLGLHGRTDESIKQYIEAIVQKPAVPLYHMELANIYMSLADYEKAKIEYKSVIILTGDKPEGHVLLSTAYVAQGQLTHALKDPNGDGLKSALQIARNYRPAHKAIADVYRRLARQSLEKDDLKDAEKHLALALVHLKRYAELDADDRDGFLTLAAFLSSQNDFDGAAGELEQALALEGGKDDLETLYELALMLPRKSESPDLSRSIKLLEHAVELDRGNIRAHKLVAEYYRRNGRFGNARKHLEFAKHVASDNIPVRLALAYVYSEMRTASNAAIRAYKWILDVDKKNAEASYNKARLMAYPRPPKNKKSLAELVELAEDARDAEPANAKYQALVTHLTSGTNFEGDPDWPMLHYYRMKSVLTSKKQALEHYKAGKAAIERLRKKEPERTARSGNVRMVQILLKRAFKEGRLKRLDVPTQKRRERSKPAPKRGRGRRSASSDRDAAAAKKAEAKRKADAATAKRKADEAKRKADEAKRKADEAAAKRKAEEAKKRQEKPTTRRRRRTPAGSR